MDPRQNPPQNQPIGPPGQPPMVNPAGPPAGASPFQQGMPPPAMPMMPPGQPPYPAGPPPQMPPSVGGAQQPPQSSAAPPQQGMPPSAMNPKQQVVEALRGASNVLITVSDNPSVDQLAAAIGLTLMMNKLGKHATAVFSGQTPSTIEFLQPHKILEANTDSLRDFIISLDREKADKLRYKIEDSVVKIFITPYRASISEADLMYSQGDFNVDVVVALGVSESIHLDQAISAHGRILHDATIIGVSSGNIITSVGSLNWCDPSASSLSEMLVSITESFRSGIIDTQMATAFLTGIVAETERFSNDKTSPKVMTISAQLMAAGANQQLISTQLELPPPPPPMPVQPTVELPPPMPEPKKDAQEFEVPKPGEGGNSSSDLISLHNEEPAPEPPKPEEKKPDEPFGKGLTAPAPAFDPQSFQPAGDTSSQIRIDENGEIIASPPPQEALTPKPPEPEPEPPVDKPADEPKKDDSGVPPEAETKSEKTDSKPEDDSARRRELLTDDENIEAAFLSDDEEEDKRSKKGRPAPLMRAHEKIIKPLAKDKNAKPKTDLKHFDFNALDSEPTTVKPEEPAPAPPPAEDAPGVELPPVTDTPPAAELPLPTPNDGDEDSARKAVLDAMATPDFKPVAESPLDALNADALPLDAPLPPVPDVPPAGPPPPAVPPPLPMTPPPAGPSFVLPTPQDNQQANPFNLPQ